MTSILVLVQGPDGPTQAEARLPSEEERQVWHVDEWRVDDFRPQPDQLCLITYAKLLLAAGHQPEPSGFLTKAIADSKRSTWQAEIWIVGDEMRLCGQVEVSAAPGAGLQRVHSASAPPGKIIYLGPGTERFKVLEPASGKMSDPTLVQRAKAIQETYQTRLEMPAKALRDLEAGHLDALARDAFVLYPEGQDVELVKALALKRAPCNIAGRNLYHAAKLRHAFGWDEGFYDAYHKATGEVLPNIAIACRTPIWFRDQEEVVNVVNLIGYAFDSPSQADYKYFKAKKGDLVEAMKVMWRHMFEAAVKMKVKKILWARVGGGAFSSMLADVAPELGRYDQEVYEKLLQLSLEPVKEEYAQAKIFLEPLGRIPDDVFSGRLGKLEELLFVNAWDMLSMVGNGNAGDNSLDGFFGRCTAMGVLCWPMTNPFLSYHPVKQGGWEPTPSTDATGPDATDPYHPVKQGGWEPANTPGTQGTRPVSSCLPPQGSVPPSSFQPPGTDDSNIPSAPPAETIVQQSGHGQTFTFGAPAAVQPTVVDGTAGATAAAAAQPTFVDGTAGAIAAQPPLVDGTAGATAAQPPLVDGQNFYQRAPLAAADEGKSTIPRPAPPATDEDPKCCSTN